MRNWYQQLQIGDKYRPTMWQNIICKVDEALMDKMFFYSNL